MELVKNVGDVFANIVLLEEIRISRESAHQKAYRSLIKRGTCFVPYSISNGIAFSPSRFIGYSGNNFTKHATNDERDGRQTNAALNHIFGHKPLSDETLEQKYQIFCQALGIETSPKGSFGVGRKFWITPDISDRLDIIAEEQVFEDTSLGQTERSRLLNPASAKAFSATSLLVTGTSDAV